MCAIDCDSRGSGGVLARDDDGRTAILAGLALANMTVFDVGVFRGLLVPDWKRLSVASSVNPLYYHHP